MKRHLCSLLVAALAIAATAYWLFGTTRKLGDASWSIHGNAFTWPAGAWLLPIGTLLVFGGLAAWSAYDRFKRAKSCKEQTASTTLAVVALTLLALLWPWSLLGPTPGGVNGVTNLVAASWSDVATGYFSAAYRIDNPRRFANEYAENWQRMQHPWEAHVATHPPGATLFYYLARRSYENVPFVQSATAAVAGSLTNLNSDQLASQCRGLLRAATGQESPLPASAVGCALWCAFLLSLAGALAVPAVYLLGSDGGAHEGRGLVAAALYLLAPTVGLFSFGIDAAIACGAAWIYVLVARHLRTGSLRSVAVAGLTLGLGSFLSFGALAAGVVATIAMLLPRPATDDRPRPPVARSMVAVAVFGAAFLAFWALLLIPFPMQPLRIYSNAMAAHHAATLGTRLYQTWVATNVLVFALFAGWPAVVGLLANFFKWKPARLQGVVTIGLATLCTVLLLTLSGAVRGEVERLWMFLLPPLCVLAAVGFAPTASPDVSGDNPHLIRRRTLLAAACVTMLVLQAGQSLLMAAALAPAVRP